MCLMYVSDIYVMCSHKLYTSEDTIGIAYAPTSFAPSFWKTAPSNIKKTKKQLYYEYLQGTNLGMFSFSVMSYLNNLE